MNAWNAKPLKQVDNLLHYTANPKLFLEHSANSRAGRYMKTHIQRTYKDTINI